MDIYFIYGDKLTTCFGLYHQAIIRSQVSSRTWGNYTLLFIKMSLIGLKCNEISLSLFYTVVSITSIKL